jgi:hypothetical protein
VNVDKKQYETIRDLLIVLLLKSGVKHEAIAEVTDLDLKYLKNKYPLSKIVRSKEID